MPSPSPAPPAALATCSQEVRNLADPTYARITYRDSRLTLELASSSVDPATGVRVPGAFGMCFTVDNVSPGVRVPFLS